MRASGQSLWHGKIAHEFICSLGELEMRQNIVGHVSMFAVCGNYVTVPLIN